MTTLDTISVGWPIVNLGAHRKRWKVYTHLVLNDRQYILDRRRRARTWFWIQTFSQKTEWIRIESEALSSINWTTKYVPISPSICKASDVFLPWHFASYYTLHYGFDSVSSLNASETRPTPSLLQSSLEAPSSETVRGRGFWFAIWRISMRSTRFSL